MTGVRRLPDEISIDRDTLNDGQTADGHNAAA